MNRWWIAVAAVVAYFVIWPAVSWFVAVVGPFAALLAKIGITLLFGWAVAEMLSALEFRVREHQQ